MPSVAISGVVVLHSSIPAFQCHAPTLNNFSRCQPTCCAGLCGRHDLLGALFSTFNKNLVVALHSHRTRVVVRLNRLSVLILQRAHTGTNSIIELVACSCAEQRRTKYSVIRWNSPFRLQTGSALATQPSRVRLVGFAPPLQNQGIDSTR